MFLFIVAGVVLVVAGVTVYQWLRPSGGKRIALHRELTQSEAQASVHQTGKNSQFTVPPF